MRPPRELLCGPRVEESEDSINPGGRQRRNSQLTLPRPAQLRVLANSICAIGSEIHPFRAGHGRRAVGFGYISIQFDANWQHWHPQASPRTRYTIGSNRIPPANANARHRRPDNRRLRFSPGFYCEILVQTIGCFTVFTEGPIYRGLATSGRAEKGSKMKFAMEPPGAFARASLSHARLLRDLVERRKGGQP